MITCEILLSFTIVRLCSNLALTIFICELCRFQRPQGPIPSSMLGLEALTGSLEDFGFEDYLNGNYYLLTRKMLFSV